MKKKYGSMKKNIPYGSLKKWKKRKKNVFTYKKKYRFPKKKRIYEKKQKKIRTSKPHQTDLKIISPNFPKLNNNNNNQSDHMPRP